MEIKKKGDYRNCTKTKIQMMRRYIQMKITVCGKGGCGKSTVTSLLAKALARRGKEVLVIDSDESNYGLHQRMST